MSFFRRKKPRSGPRLTRRNHRDGKLLEVTATGITFRRRRNERLMLQILQIAVVIGLLVFLGMSVRALLVSQIFTNPKYQVRVIEVNTDGIMSREEALKQTGIKEGVNIYSLNLESAQRVLSAIPEVKMAKVERIVPDTVSIKIEGRIPVAWIAPRNTGEDPTAMESAFLVDAAGVMMKSAPFVPGRLQLPVVYGVPTEQWRAGDRIDLPELLSTLELFTRAAERHHPEVVLRAADISKGWCIEAWENVQTRYTFGMQNIAEQLDRLQLIMTHVAQTSQKLASVNLIPERNTPVTFQGDVPAAWPVPEVVKKKTKR